MDINEEAYAIQEEVVEFRRALHRCPEIAFHETMTDGIYQRTSGRMGDFL